MIIQHSPEFVNLEHFADAGARFTLVIPGTKKPKDQRWQIVGRSLQEAIEWAKAGKPVGVQTNEIPCLDLDSHYTEFALTFPYYARTWCTWHEDAPHKRKLFYKLVGPPPPSATWPPPSDKELQQDPNTHKVQLLGARHQAVIHGLHEDGHPYITDTETHPLLEVTREELAPIWKFWTGEELIAEDPKPAPRRQPRRHTRPGDGLVARVKAAWPAAMDVFTHHGLAGQVEREGKDQWRLRHNGGLIVGDNDKAWRWYCHAEQIGGDQVDAWGWCVYGARWDPKDRDPVLFKATLRAMAEAAGVPVEDADRDDRKDVTSFERLKAWAASWDGWNARTREMDRSAYIELLYLAEERGSDTLDIGCRELAERVGCGHSTANRALARLAELGLIEVAEQADEYHAPTWRICSLVGHIIPAEGVCPVGLHIFNGDDAFLWGSKLSPEHATPGDAGGCIGTTGRSFLAALLAQNDLGIGEIAERSGMSRVTASKKAHIFAALRLVKLSKVGRRVICHLVGHWRRLLDSLRRRLTTFGRGLKRRIEHVTHRAGNCERLLQYLPERLAEYRERIVATYKRSMALLRVLEAELQALGEEV